MTVREPVAVGTAFVLGILGRRDILIQFPHLRDFATAAEVAALKGCCGDNAELTSVVNQATYSLRSMSSGELERLKGSIGISNRDLLFP